MKFHAYQPPTLSTPIGHLMPQRRYASWLIGGEESTTEVADLTAAVADHGLAFMRSHVELAAIGAALEDGLGHQLEYRLPVVLALSGDQAEARSALSRSLSELDGREDPAAQELRRFAEAFERWEV